LRRFCGENIGNNDINGKVCRIWFLSCGLVGEWVDWSRDRFVGVEWDGKGMWGIVWIGK
jgi:hypothetical protein